MRTSAGTPHSVNTPTPPPRCSVCLCITTTLPAAPPPLDTPCAASPPSSSRPPPPPPPPSPALPRSWLVASCGHPLCRGCGEAIVTFAADLPSASSSSSGGAPCDSSSAAADKKKIEFWCPACGCTREATVQQHQAQAHTRELQSWDQSTIPADAEASGKKDVGVEREGEEESPDINTVTPTNPKRRRRKGASAAPAAAIVMCVMCQAAGNTGVAAKYVCEECTKASPFGKTVMVFCESCWSRAHWSPWMMSHVKSGPVSTAAAATTDFTSSVKMCENHQLPLDVFCQTDNTFICTRCVIYSSHKGHDAVPVQDMTLGNHPSLKAFFGQLSKVATDLNLLAVSIKSEAVKITQDQKKLEENVQKEFSDVMSRLHRRQDKLISTSMEIASSKVCALSRQLEIISAGLEHIEKYQSKCLAILKSGDESKIIELFGSIPGILKQLELKPECLSPCTTSTWTYIDDTAAFKEKIPLLCFISSRPVVECFTSGPNTVTLWGQWGPTAKNEDIRVRVGEFVCTNLHIVAPGSILSFTVPEDGVGCDLPVSLSVFGTPSDSPNDPRFSFPGPKITNVTKVTCARRMITITGQRFGTSPTAITASVNGVLCRNMEVKRPNTEITCKVPPQLQADEPSIHTLTLAVAGQRVSSTLYFEDIWEWDTGCCGRLLSITNTDKSTVHKSRVNVHGQSTAIATTQLAGDRVYEWHLSITDLVASRGDKLVVYGVMPRPLDNSELQHRDIYGWATDGTRMRLPHGTPAFQATGGSEEVTLRYDPRTLTLTATWPLHHDAATVRNVPSGLYPAVNLHNCNSVKITTTPGTH
ncbi:hypothetical protein Pelo_6094 [Pelomyxa schiedti]|nr:hypothetical protein Pelo_6094 [Pelomyxa schiedti]